MSNIDSALELARSGESTGGARSHQSLNALADEVDRLRAEMSKLLSAIETLKRAKGRYNTGIAYDRLMEVAGKLEAGAALGQAKESK